MAHRCLSNRIAGVDLERPRAVPRGPPGPELALDRVTAAFAATLVMVPAETLTETPPPGSAPLLPSLGLVDSLASLTLRSATSCRSVG